MRYAKSLLLGGQLIDAEEVDPNSYQELICVCPHNRKKVKLVSYPGLPQFEGGEESKIFTWVHSEKISIPEKSECNEKNLYYKSQKYILDDVARVLRLNLLKPNLLKLIKSSAIFKQPVTFENLGNTLNDSLIKWFAQRLELSTSDEMFQDTAKIECQNLYEHCIRPALIDKSHWISKENTDKFTTHNHLFYGSKIAGEMLECALADFDGKDRRILIYLGTNEAVQESMQAAAFILSNLANSLLKGKEKSDFQQLWVSDKYQGMEKIREVAKKNSGLCTLYNDYTKNILYQFTINLSLIFWFIPWIEELKKINQESNFTNIC
ncbi:MAG: hypothetical protein F6K48_18570 [Okeania sp. SIO3H1]|uniref:hypothetical protein n=1 Tax=Okeania sp. SIO1I7 TaxID=2607772 RepID=UPI0013C98259|nr:hypothetical protein [Okeania sp. SIO1I7]NEN90807.1 hypothetical protein [Okeania sp. SIO3H1]NET28857.1 hypothetical protein [Okeania sp. SIO1I7]